jgi:putative SbcD/Mre11-related phosphoesterase
MRALYDRRAVLLEPSNSPNRYLVVSDLHIGFEEKFRGSGVRLRPSIDSMINDLESLIDQYEITDLVIDGDVKSGVDRILESEWNNVPKFFSRATRKCRVSVVPGNHDGGLSVLLPENVTLEDINGKLIEDTLVLHGHPRPLIKFKDAKRIILGHVHPIFRKRGSPLSGRPVWAFLKIRKKLVFRKLLEDSNLESLIEVVVMPSFNTELSSSGYVPEEKYESRKGFSLSKDLKMAEDAVIVTLEGEVIGDVSNLQTIM